MPLRPRHGPGRLQPANHLPVSHPPVSHRMHLLVPLAGATATSTSVASRGLRNMDNLHRELAPISDSAWAQIEEEATRTLKRHLAARRVVDLHGPEGFGLSAIGIGHVSTIAPPGEAVTARLRVVRPLVELRVPFDLDRQAIDDVERGAEDSDWQ